VTEAEAEAEAETEAETEAHNGIKRSGTKRDARPTTKCETENDSDDASVTKGTNVTDSVATGLASQPRYSYGESASEAGS
jgi:hypothetical protein